MKISSPSSFLYSSAALLLTADYVTSADVPTLLLSTDDSFNFELLNPLGSATTGGGDIAEVLSAAKNIKAGDFESFSLNFWELANRTKARALDEEIAYDPINVQDSWFSAAKYFRRADFYLHGNWDDPRLDLLWTEQTVAFDNAIHSLPVPGERVKIPTDGFTIEGIWYAAHPAPAASSNTSAQTQTLVITNGYDASQEDVYHQYVAAALARGWNCFTFDGPGQGSVRRDQNIGFIPDWERVVTPVVDYLLTEKATLVDLKRFVLLGNSMGGYLAARAAAFEHRFSAIVLDGGIWDFHAGFAAQLPEKIQVLFSTGNQSAFDDSIFALTAQTNISATIRWGVDQGLWSFYTHSPYEWLNMTRAYAIEDVVGKIQAPVFIADGEYETIFTGQPETLKNALGSKATLHIFNGTAGYHCQIGAVKEANSVIFGWLNKTLGKK